jgi:beta-glucanase (GH16 family)
MIVIAAALNPASAQCVALPGCELVWADEFDGAEVDLTKWSFQLGDGDEVGLPSGWGNNELQFYQAENATVADGMLTITAREESINGFDYTSARMRSLGKGDWTYGRIEMRAKMPFGPGMWPAFWMLPSDSLYGGWAGSGEIDIVELIGNNPERVLGTIHYGAPWPFTFYSSENYYLPAGTFNDDFHLFAIEWELGEIRWYVDDILYSTRNSWFSTGGPFPAPFNADFHLLLNLAVGGNLPGPPNVWTSFPQEFVIDHVRVFQSPPIVSIATPTAGDALFPGDDLTITAQTLDTVSIQRVQFLQDKALLGEDLTPPYELTIPGVAAGCYRLRARAWDETGTPTTSAPVDLVVGEGCPQAPYLLAPVILPGVIEVENYDLGGQDVSYNDLDSSNNGGAYRPMDGVDLEGTADLDGGFNLGWTMPGEWLEYAVDVEAGTYDLELRVASLTLGGTMHLELNGVDVTGPISFPATGGWQDWNSATVEGVTLHPGRQTMRVVIDSGAFNLNKIRVMDPPDQDQDGVADRDDRCVSSIMDPTIIIQACDSLTPNLLDDDGCTFSDSIAEAAAGADNHGRFVSAVAQMMNDAKRRRLINGSEKAAVVSCAAQSDLPLSELKVDRISRSRSKSSAAGLAIRSPR